MTITPDNSAAPLLEFAMRALQAGDRRIARHYAEQALRLAPQYEEPWLLLVYLSAPQAARYYLNRARQINPNSPRVLAAQAWLEKQSTPRSAAARPSETIAPTQPVRLHAANKATARGLRFSLGVLILLALLAGTFVLGGAAPLPPSGNATLVSAVQTALNITPTVTSSATPSPTWTLTASPSPTPTATATPTDTPTPTPTASPTPTDTPTTPPTATQAPATATPVTVSYYTVAPGDTLMKIAQRYSISVQDLVAANNIPNPSVISAGQVLTIPAPGQVPAAARATATPSQPGQSGQGKEILIDISEQHLYAYQDNELVFSLVVSTGIGNSTRIGTFKVLDKIPRAYSSAFNIWMPWWMGIYYSGSLENGIHGLPLLMNGVELWGNLIGQPATYGCIESRTSDIKQLYDWAEIGTKVIIQR